jgi:hypothetical protein
VFIRLSLVFLWYNTFSFEDNIAILNEKRQYDDTVREIENGAQLICVVPTGTRVVFQVSFHLSFSLSLNTNTVETRIICYGTPPSFFSQ